jgi:hypothetical protein
LSLLSIYQQHNKSNHEKNHQEASSTSKINHKNRNVLGNSIYLVSAREACSAPQNCLPLLFILGFLTSLFWDKREMAFGVSVPKSGFCNL